MSLAVLGQNGQYVKAVSAMSYCKLGTHGATAFLPERSRKRADEFARQLAPTIEQLKQNGYTTLEAIAEQLNRMDVPTAREGARWHIPTVFHLLKRIERLG